MKMYSPTPECGECESRNVHLDSNRVEQEEITFYRCRECGALTPNFDDEEMFRLEEEANQLFQSKPDMDGQ